MLEEKFNFGDFVSVEGISGKIPYAVFYMKHPCLQHYSLIYVPDVGVQSFITNDIHHKDFFVCGHAQCFGRRVTMLRTDFTNEEAVYLSQPEKGEYLLLVKNCGPVTCLISNFSVFG